LELDLRAMVCACKTMRTIRFCAVLVAVCAVFAVGVAVGGAGQVLQRYQIVTNSGQAAGIITFRLDRWTGRTWFAVPRQGEQYKWERMPMGFDPYEPWSAEAPYTPPEPKRR
jgi:hypothetical protein